MSVFFASSLTAVVLYRFFSNGKDKCPKCNQLSFCENWNDDIIEWEITECDDDLSFLGHSISLKEAVKLYRANPILV